MLATSEGRLVEAEALSIEAYKVWNDAGMPEALVYRAVASVAIRREQGRLAEIIDPWSRHVEAHPRDSSSKATVAFARLESGDADAAATALHDQAAAGFETMPADAGWPIAIAMWSEIAAAVADRESAGPLHDLAETWDGAQVVTGGINLGPMARLLARLELVLDRPDDADRHFAEAVEQSTSLGSPVWIARCSLDWAESFADRGDTARARELVDRANEAIDTLTLPRLQDQSATLTARLTA
jgi:hypothetical protein